MNANAARKGVTSRDEAVAEAESGVRALRRLNIEATGGVEYAYGRRNEDGTWRSYVRINGRTAGQLALEVIAARAATE